MELQKYIGDFINHLHEGVLVLDERMCVVMRNRAAERILGIRINPRKKICITDVMMPLNEDLPRIISNACITCNNYKTHEITYHRKKRDIRIRMTVHAQQRKNESRGHYYFIILNDITELWGLHHREKRLRSQLQKNYHDQMENLRQIAQSVAHEVRNPIVSIGGYANFLLRKYNPARHGAEEYKKYFSYIREDVDRLSGIVSQVEKYSDISEIRLKKENMVRIVREALRFGKRTAARRSVPFEAAEIETGEYHMFVDRARLKRVLHNLVKHAINLSDRETPVRAQATFTGFEAGLILEIHTAMPREEVPFLFNPFYSGRKQRLNFDLAAAQRIIILHGGIITTAMSPENVLSIRLSLPREKRLVPDGPERS